VTGWGALAIAGGFSAVAAALGWLTGGGAAAAVLIGWAVFWGGGLAGGALLALFFVSGSLLTSALRRRPVDGDVPPAGGRTWRQVLANGAWAGAGALLIPTQPHLGWPVLVGALAAAQADTWGTEIGGLSPRRPRLITTGRDVPPGTSGGVTPLGTAAGVAGAVAMGGLAAALGAPTIAALAAFAGGNAGTLADSLLGAGVQARYHCPACAVDTESRRHRCGTQTRHVSGHRWIDNDVVNLGATTAGAAVAVGLASLVRGM